MEISEELKEALGKAIKAYGDILWRVYLGLDIPEEFQDYEKLSKSELKNKMAMLKDFYNSL